MLKGQPKEHANQITSISEEKSFSRKETNAHNVEEMKIALMEECSRKWGRRVKKMNNQLMNAVTLIQVFVVMIISKRRELKLRMLSTRIMLKKKI